MSFTHTITSSVSVTGGEGTSHSKSYTADSEKRHSIPVPDSSTDLEVSIAIDVSLLSNLYLASDQDVTIETNNPTTPDDTISLKADVPLIWNADAYFTNPLTTDVTKFYITNSSGAAATVVIEVLEDSTP